jgi:magnesium transporter
MTETTRLFLPEIREMLADGQAGEVVQVLRDVHPSDWAELLTDLEGAEREQLFRALHEDLDLQLGVFRQLESEAQVELLRAVGYEALTPLLPRLPSDEQTDFVAALAEEEQRQILSALPPADRADVTRLLRYTDGTIGSCMQIEFVAVDQADTAELALQRVRRAPREAPVSVLYVLDDQRRLLGRVSLTKLVRAEAETRLEELFEPQVQALQADAPREDAVRALQKYDVVALPVINPFEQLIGIITYDDVMDVMEEEATEDAQMMGAVSPLESSYLQTSIWTFANKRGGWLTVLFFGQFLTLAVMSLFPDARIAATTAHPEHLLATVTALLMFIPLVVSAGGNCGSQSATLICRALATDDITLRDWWRVALRELAMGMLLGTFVAGLGYFYARYLFHQPEFRAQDYALVVALSLVGIMTFSNLLGGLLPFVLKRIGLDPAIASTPLVASLSDATGTLIFYTVSWFVILEPLLAG